MRLFKIVLIVGVGLVTGVRRFLSPSSDSSDSDNKVMADEGVWNSLVPKSWQTAKYFAAFMVVMALGGFLVSALGLIPITASSGHWSITKWFLDFSKRRSISTYSTSTETHSLNEASLILKGAGHYEVGCAACHGSPKLPQPRIAQAMTPAPPALPPRISRWDPNELFYIVKHGIKFTGMPAWPSQQRDDEVWSVVAFLRTLPDLDTEEYRQLIGESGSDVAGEAEPLDGLMAQDKFPSLVVENCGRCHGVDGLGRGAGAYPKLSGQRVDYLFASLQAYSRNERHSGIMGPIAAGLSAEGMRQLSLYYSGLSEPPPSVSSQRSFEGIQRGRTIAQDGIPSQRVPACLSCHGGGSVPRNPTYPKLAGQYAAYLKLQLTILKNKQRGGTAYSHVMQMVAERLSVEQMNDVALYFESLPSTLE